MRFGRQFGAWFLLLSGVGIFSGIYFSGYGRHQTADSPWPRSPVATPGKNNAVGGTLAHSPNSRKPPSTPNDLFDPKANKAALFAFLFSQDFPQWISDEPSALSVLRARLARPYPLPGPDPHDRAAEAELMVRLGIVKALGSSHAPLLRAFYLSLLHDPREHWLVKRQALKNFRDNNNVFRSEDERSALLAGIDPRAITTAGLSDSELVERGLHAK